MRRIAQLFCSVLLLAALPLAAQTAQDTAFTYQGQLLQNNLPFTGAQNMTFTLFDAVTGGTQIGTIPLANVPVTDGLFTVNLDFGGASFITPANDARWLEIKVGTTTLSPRTKLENSPYALTADFTYSVAAGSIGTTQINPAQVQERVSGTCASGSAVSAVNADGTVACQAAGDSLTLPYAATQAYAGPLFNVTNTDTSSASTALQGTSNSTAANVSAVEGVIGSTTPGLFSAGVRGVNNSTTSNGIGVYGTTAGSGPGVNGTSASGPGVYGQSTSSVGVYATSSNGSGLYATSNNGNAAQIVNTNAGNGSTTLYVNTNGANAAGLAAYATSGLGGFFSAGSGAGVEATSGTGVPAVIYNNNSANTSNVLLVTTNSAGPANDQTGTGGALFQVNNLNSTAAAVHGNVNTALYSTSFPPTLPNAGVYGTASGTGGYGGFFAATNTTSGSAATALEVVSYASFADGAIEVWNEGASRAMYIDNQSATSRAVQIDNQSSGPALYLFENNGNDVAVFSAGGGLGQVARIDRTGKGFFDGGTQTGGADLAEIINTSGAVPQPGDVVEIDPDNPDHFRLASTPASTRVAGVISTRPSVTMNADDGASADIEGPALALAGRVPVKVTDEGGPIRIGDLLVASSTPGRAMRAADDPKIGTVIGKALQELHDGEGTITMLVWAH